MPRSRAQLCVSRGTGRSRTRFKEDASVALLWYVPKPLALLGLSQAKSRNTRHGKSKEFVQELVKYLMTQRPANFLRLWYMKNHCSYCRDHIPSTITEYSNKYHLTFMSVFSSVPRIFPPCCAGLGSADRRRQVDMEKWRQGRY